MEGEFVDDKTKGMIKYYANIPVKVRLSIRCPFFTMSEEERSRLKDLDIVKAENHVLEVGDYTD